MSHKQENEETKNSDDYTFLQEKIKDRPINKKKLVRKMLLTAGAAIIFGFVACLTFLCLEPVFSNIINSNTKPELQHVEINEETDEGLDILPEIDIVETPIEDMALTDSDMVSENSVESPEDSATEIVPEIVPDFEIELEDYQLLYRKMYALGYAVQKSLVTVTRIENEPDWMNGSTQNYQQTCGVIIGDNGRELLILADGARLDLSEDIRITFCDGTVLEGNAYGRDEETGLAIYAVDLATIPNETKSAYTIISIGSSYSTGIMGNAVVAVGYPLGTNSSVCYGAITSTSGFVQVADATYPILTTDIYGSKNASGILINMQGKLVGIISNSYNNPDMPNMISAYGISGIRKLIENLSNATATTHLGLYLRDIPQNISQIYSFPQGAYVTKVAMDSPSMNVGICSGDIVTAINHTPITNVNDYMSIVQSQELEGNVTITVARLNGQEYREMDLVIRMDLL